MEKIKLEKYCVNKIDNVPAKDDYDIDYIDISSVDNVLKKVIGYSTYNIAEAPSRAKQILEKNDVLVSTVRPNLNAVALCDFETENVLVGSTGFCVLRGNDKVNSKYLFYFCQSNHFVGELMKVATGASYPAVSKNDVKNVLIPKHQIEKQNDIVETLDKVSGIINYRKEQLRLFDDLIKSRFIEIFGDPIENEKGFEIVKMTDVTSLVTCGVAARPEYVESGIPFLSSQNVGIRQFFIDGNYKFITKENHDKLTKKNKPQKGDILYSRVGARLGKAAIVDFDFEFSVYVSLTLIKSIDEKINSEYLVSYLNSDRIMQMALGSTTGIGVPNLNVDVVRNYDIPLPPRKLQDQYVSFLKQVDKLKVAVQKSLDETQILFNSLMQECFD